MIIGIIRSPYQVAVNLAWSIRECAREPRVTFPLVKLERKAFVTIHQIWVCAIWLATCFLVALSYVLVLPQRGYAVGIGIRWIVLELYGFENAGCHGIYSKKALLVVVNLTNCCFKIFLRYSLVGHLFSLGVFVSVVERKALGSSRCYLVLKF